jgi:hypothetical protein
MVDLLSIKAPWDGDLQFINNLQAYNASRGTDEMLDLIREIQSSGNYYWQGLVFPRGDNSTVAGFGTVEGTIQIPQGTFVTSITHYDTVEDENRAGGGALGWGFKFKLYDKGTKASIFYGDYSLNRPVSSNMELHYGVGSNFPPSDPGMNLDNPYGPGYLMSPFIITNPGVLGWEIVNLDPNPSVIQVMLACAVPIRKDSIGQKVVSKR